MKRDLGFIDQIERQGLVFDHSATVGAGDKPGISSLESANALNCFSSNGCLWCMLLKKDGPQNLRAAKS